MRNRNRVFGASSLGSSGGAPWPVAGLIHYWKLEESAHEDRIDSVGSLPFVAVNESVTRVAGINNFAAQVDSNGILSANFTEPSSFSIALWIKTGGSLTDPTEILLKNGLDFQFDLQVQTDGTVLWYVNDPGTPLDSGPDKVTFGAWNLIVAGYDASTSRLSVNGGSNNSTFQAHTPGLSDMTLYNGTSLVPVFVDEFSFYNRGLSGGDIAALWAGGAGLFL